MNQPNSEPYIRSMENPNGLFEVILDPAFTDMVPDFDKRLTIATADIEIFLTDVVGVDSEMAKQVAMRAVQEVLAATAITLEQDELTKIFLEANDLTAQ